MVRRHTILRRHILECGCEISQQSETSVRRLIAVINLESRTPRGFSGDWGPNKGGTTCQRPCKVFLRGLFIIFKIEDSPLFSFTKAVNFVFHLLEVLKDNQSQIMASV